jgi:hypothetical protein
MVKDEMRLFLIRHGAIVALLGSLAGLGYMFVITGDFPGSFKAWHLAHLQGVMTGIMIIAVSSLVTRLSLNDRKLRILAYSFVIFGYCYSIGPVFGAVVGVEGIEPALPLANMLFYASNTIASLSVLLGLGLIIYGARKVRSRNQLTSSLSPSK